MSTHQNIASTTVDLTPSFHNGDTFGETNICFEINAADFLWAGSKEEAIDFLDNVIEAAKAAKQAVRSGMTKAAVRARMLEGGQ
jgi:hypothetical protein